MYRIVYSKKSLKHVQNIKTANLEKQIKELMNVLRENPFRNPPPAVYCNWCSRCYRGDGIDT